MCGRVKPRIHAKRMYMKLTIWAEHDWIVSVIGTLYERNGILRSERNNHNERKKPITWMLHGKKQSQFYDWVNALWAEWKVSGAERNRTEQSVNGKFVNFKMFLTVTTSSYKIVATVLPESIKMNLQTEKVLHRGLVYPSRSLYLVTSTHFSHISNLKKNIETNGGNAWSEQFLFVSTMFSTLLNKYT